MNAESLIRYYERIADAPEAISRLRRFILDLAVRGKLVPQDAKNEPASELLRRIMNDKTRLAHRTKQKKIGVEKEHGECRWPFVLPHSWVWARLGDIAQYGIPEKVASNTSITADTWVLDLEDIEKDTSRLIVRITSADRPFQSAKTVFERGDVLFGKLRPYLNKCLVADEDGVCTTEIVPIRGYCDLVPEYVRLVLKSPLTMTRVDRLMYGMKMPRLGTEDALSLSFPLPPISEQHCIVAKVDELMALCDELEAARKEREAKRDRLTAASLARLNAPDPETFQADARFALDALPALTTRPDQIKQLRQAILNLAVRGKLVAQNAHEEPARALLEKIRDWKRKATESKEIRAPRKPLRPVEQEDAPYSCPAGWAWSRLGEIIYIRSGDGLVAANMKGGVIPVYGGNGVNGYHDRGNVERETIVIGRVGYYCGSIHETPQKAWVTDNAFITHFCEEAIDRNFLKLLLTATNLKEDENATAQPVISGSKIYPIVVGLPPLLEQRRIVAKIDELMALCDRLDAGLTHSDNARSGLLDALLQEALAPVDSQQEAA